MICLKNRTFAVSQTSYHLAHVAQPALWFAWKIVLLQYHKHPMQPNPHRTHRCDLLEKSYFCSITNISKKDLPVKNPVVICLKNRTFAVSQTSGRPVTLAEQRLWFAWKIVLLQYHKHRPPNMLAKPPSCDLLEKSYFCSITNIPLVMRKNRRNVVICLKNRTFAVSQTSNIVGGIGYTRLWFAWKIVLLQYHKHQAWRWLHRRLVVICLKNRTFAVSQTSHPILCRRYLRCDLLEKSYFCSITNILPLIVFIVRLVVICLKNRTFAVSQTSSLAKGSEAPRCDLLEKSYFCSITNIIGLPLIPCGVVVICLKNRTFAVSQTSEVEKPQLITGCDLLEKSYFCSITNI